MMREEQREGLGGNDKAKLENAFYSRGEGIRPGMF